MQKNSSPIINKEMNKKILPLKMKKKKKKICFFSGEKEIKKLPMEFNPIGSFFMLIRRTNDFRFRMAGRLWHRPE